MCIDCNFSNNIFDFVEYDNLLESYVKEHCSKSKTEESINKLFDRIINSNIKIDHQIESKEYLLLSNSIKSIIAFEPGRKLFKGLLKHDRSVKVKISQEKKSCYRPEVMEVVLSNSVDVDDIYIISQSLDGIKRFQKINLPFILAHEFIHFLHDSEGSLKRNHLVTEGLIHSSLDNLEEQHAILGIILDPKGNYIFDPICENTFNKLLGLSSRINHRGGTLNGTSPNALDAAHCGVIAHLESLLESEPDLINRLFIKENKLFSLLSAAINNQHVEVIDFLLTKGQTFII